MTLKLLALKARVIGGGVGRPNQHDLNPETLCYSGFPLNPLHNNYLPATNLQ